MTKNPYVNACAALVYISVVATILNYGEKLVGPVKSIIGPIAFLSLFVFSAAMMGYIFFYEPVQLYLDGEKKQALSLFTRTLAIFACITAVLLVCLYFVTHV